MKVGIITLGCDKNTVDSERYLAQLSDYSAEYTADLAKADVIIVNTCGFIDAPKRNRSMQWSKPRDIRPMGGARLSSRSAA